MAFLVVATHTSFFSFIKSPDISEMVTTALAIKVPFFFTASGFLVWYKIWNATQEEKLHRIQGWIKKTLRLYLVWTLIYLPFSIYGFYLDEVGPLKAIAVFLRNVLLVGQNFWSWPLWYLLGMLVAACMVYAMVKRGWKNSTMYGVAIGLAVLGCLLDECHARGWFSMLVEPYFKLFQTTRNGFFQGFPYIMIGITIASQGVLKSRGGLFLLFLSSFVIHMCGVKLATFVMTYALFSLVIQTDFRERKDNFYRNCRLMSTMVYFVHMIWVGTLTLLFPQLSSTELFVWVVALSFMTAKVAIHYKESCVVKYCFR